MKVTKAWIDAQFINAHTKAGDEWGHRWRGSQKFRYQLCLNMIRKCIESDDPLQILDIGCGLADFTREVWALGPRNEVTGVDICEGATRIASELYYPQLHFKNGQLPHLGFASDKFDVITALEVIGYLDDNERGLAFGNIQRMLKAGGYFLFSGGINRGPGYFEPNDILHTISEYFEVVNVKYNYSYLCNKLERFMRQLKWRMTSLFGAKVLAKISEMIWGYKRATHIFVLARKREK